MKRPQENIAFKVTWAYGKHGPFSSPCTARGREINIIKEKKVWCSDSDCNCRKIYNLGNNGDYSDYPMLRTNLRDPDQWPCYDALIFREWRFGGGLYHNGPRKGRPIPIKRWGRGKLAFFTARKSGMEESERKIIGCFKIDGMIEDQDWGYVLHAEASSTRDRYRVANLDGAPSFWKHHRQKGWDPHTQRGKPRWGTGLFRYISDEEARQMFDAILADSTRF